MKHELNCPDCEELIALDLPDDADLALWQRTLAMVRCDGCASLRNTNSKAIWQSHLALNTAKQLGQRLKQLNDKDGLTPIQKEELWTTENKLAYQLQKWKRTQAEAQMARMQFTARTGKELPQWPENKVASQKAADLGW